METGGSMDGKEVIVLLRRNVFILLVAVLLATLFAPQAFSQTAVPISPAQSGVRGSGAIATTKGQGVLTINVVGPNPASAGSAVGVAPTGGFRYS